MNRRTGIAAALLLMSALGTAVQAGVAARFDIQTGGTTGNGRLQDTPFTWTSSRAIDKTMESTLRVRDFSGQNVTFVFDSPVDIEYAKFWSLSAASSSSITFYDASGAVIPAGKTVTSSAEEVTGFAETIENGVILFAGRPGKDNYSAQIDILPAVARVSKIVIEVKKENGLMDMRIGGTGKR